MCKTLQGIQQAQKIQNRFSRTPSIWQNREKGEIASRNSKPNRLKNEKPPILWLIKRGTR
ncbi:unnamed protein product, partial [Nesidiocoris tenuis]